MTANLPAKHLVLADSIEALLCRDVAAGPDVMAYIHGTYGPIDSGEIKALVENPDSGERETLVELIFFPDESVQVQLETVLADHPCLSGDVAAIATELADRNLSATVTLGGTGQTLTIRVDRTVIESILTRLNIVYTLEADLNRTVTETVPADKQNAVKVRLRNARFEPAGGQRDFLHRYIRAACSDDEFLDDLDFLLAFMQEIDPDGDMYDAMMRRKKRCWRQLNKFARFEERLRRTNIETLLLQGERFPYVDRAQMHQTIAAIDRIALTVYQTTEPIEPVDQVSDSYASGDGRDAADMFRRLSTETGRPLRQVPSKPPRR